MRKLFLGMRGNALTMDLSSVLPEDLAEKAKEAAQLSMGTEISELDILNISNLCDQVKSGKMSKRKV